MYFTEASGQDLFAMVKHPENTESLKLNDNGRIIELMLLAVFNYNKNVEKATYVVVKVPNEDSVDIAQIIRLRDGRSALYIDVDYDTKLRVFDDYQKLIEENSHEKENGANDDKDIYNTKQQTRKRSISKITRVPKLSWYAQNGYHIEQIPVHKKILKNELSEEEKTLVAVTTYPIVVRNSFIALALVVVLAVAAAICFAGMMSGIEGAIAFMAIFIVGSFVINRFGGIFDGFDIIGGTRRIKMPIGYHILYRLTAPIAMLWGALSGFILSMFGKNEKFKMLLLPRIAMPKGCGLDDIIYVYKKYEAYVDKMDAINMQLEKEAKQKELLEQQSKTAIEKATAHKSDLEKQNKNDYSYHTANKIRQIDDEINKLKKAQKQYNVQQKESDEKLHNAFNELKEGRSNDVNSLNGR